ncbi:uncharacterized protein LOC129927902 isoform X1 [Biomphalaria glabrata]|uniref:Uncharacterized protein LOC129927902 isoform X1 n=2 Tax=Biomphalaria glabrata TaxID=6526 RepID=A0A9W3B873_BIOGL|nr:uncharacterized protein LOC129927902 isoform X1 [Biomphalaria glabrata]
MTCFFWENIRTRAYATRCVYKKPWSTHSCITPAVFRRTCGASEKVTERVKGKMAKFLPVIGEAYTSVESLIYLGASGLAKVWGDDEAAEKGLEKAGNCWKEYSETNVIAAPVNMAVHKAKGQKGRVEEIQKSLGNAFEGVVNGTPVVGHVKGIVHYAMGDTEKGNICMESATRSAAVMGAGIVTGGIGAGLLVGAGAGITTGVAYDGVATGIDHAVNGDKAYRHGAMVLVQNPKNITPEELVGGVLGIAGDGLAGAGGNQLGKNIRARLTGQKALHNKYKNSQQLKESGTKARHATKITMDAAEQSKQAQANLSEPTKYATSLVEDSATGERGVGHSGKYRKQDRIDHHVERGYASEAKAKKATGYDQPSHLQATYEDVGQVHQLWPQAACAEHPAFDQLKKRSPNYSPENVKTATVYNKNDGGFHTRQRCENCHAYGDAMGKVVTDYIPDQTHVPSSGYVADGHMRAAVSGVVAAQIMRGGRRYHSHKS